MASPSTASQKDTSPGQDPEFHDLLLTYDPALKDWQGSLFNPKINIPKSKKDNLRYLGCLLVIVNSTSDCNPLGVRQIFDKHRSFQICMCPVLPPFRRPLTAIWLHANVPNPAVRWMRMAMMKIVMKKMSKAKRTSMSSKHGWTVPPLLLLSRPHLQFQGWLRESVRFVEMLSLIASESYLNLVSYVLVNNGFIIPSQHNDIWPLNSTILSF